MLIDRAGPTAGDPAANQIGYRAKEWVRTVGLSRTTADGSRNRTLAGWRWMLAGGLAVGVAVAGGVTALVLSSPASGQQPATTSLPGTTVSSPVQLVNATTVLRSAAAAALKEPDVVPRSDQFVYTRYADGRQQWESVDGSQTGLIENPDGSKQTVTNTYTPAYNPNLPTDGTALLRYLNNGMPYDPTQSGDVNRVGKGLMELMDGSYVRPTVRAALFDAVAQLPGLHVVPNATDGSGRTGVGISWTYSGSNELIFDPTTYQFLGVTTMSANGDVGMSSVTQVAIVDHVGDLPES